MLFRSSGPKRGESQRRHAPVVGSPWTRRPGTDCKRPVCWSRAGETGVRNPGIQAKVPKGKQKLQEPKGEGSKGFNRRLRTSRRSQRYGAKTPAEGNRSADGSSVDWNWRVRNLSGMTAGWRFRRRKTVGRQKRGAETRWRKPSRSEIRHRTKTGLLVEAEGMREPGESQREACRRRF